MNTYFTVDEFRSRERPADGVAGAPYPHIWLADRYPALCSVLDPVRGAWGHPLVVVSGYRTPELNAFLAKRSGGVAKSSQHVQGRAADIRPLNPTRERVAELHDLTKQLYADGKLERLGGLGLYPGWIHLDVRARGVDGRLATWGGAGFGSEP